ncbi:unnamed protein product [Sphenostylis stenocarpa]|uniref:Hsp70-interacting protein N-terminal domain-containing protein n=1 Tax=Sphenostylis stenocarpa TaxID=92480 RepID=A0AA86VX43_9FABA|nr:unnamed protein product [Sphenostylis stenocarpa]
MVGCNVSSVACISSFIIAKKVVVNVIATLVRMGDLCPKPTLINSSSFASDWNPILKRAVFDRRKMEEGKLRELKQFIETCKSNPSLLHNPSLSFFKAYLLRFCFLPLSSLSPILTHSLTHSSSFLSASASVLASLPNQKR